MASPPGIGGFSTIILAQFPPRKAGTIACGTKIRAARRIIGLRLNQTALISPIERLARAYASPTRSGPEGSSRNEFRLGRVQPLTPILTLRENARMVAGHQMAFAA